ncbi:hypothetical protein V6Z11_A05G240300 [Gossypium hirsutum]
MARMTARSGTRPRRVYLARVRRLCWCTEARAWLLEGTEAEAEATAGWGLAARVFETLTFWAFRVCSCSWTTSFCNWIVNWTVMI